MPADGYVIQKLRSACEFLVSGSDLKTRLVHASAKLRDLTTHEHHLLEPFSDDFASIFDQLKQLAELTDEEMYSVAQDILKLFESALSLR